MYVYTSDVGGDRVIAGDGSVHEAPEDIVLWVNTEAPPSTQLHLVFTVIPVYREGERVCLCCCCI